MGRRKVTSKLLEQDTSAEKLYILNEYGYISHVCRTSRLTLAATVT